jgi:hypothetical protein
MGITRTIAGSTRPIVELKPQGIWGSMLMVNANSAD